MWWTIFGDPSRPDPFHEATFRALEGLGQSPSAGTGGVWPFALEHDVRLSDLAADRLFTDAEVETIPTTVAFTATQIRGLYSTFSSITRLPDDVRPRLLDELVRIAEDEFDGRVERNLLAVLYTAERTTCSVPD